MLHTSYSYGPGAITFFRRTGLVTALVALCFASGVRAEKPVQRSVRAGDAADGAIGPDIVMSGISDEESYGSEDGVSALMFGQINCNRSDEWVAYFSTTNEHPIMTQNFCRLSQGRFEQLGESWVYHEFYATDSNYCGQCSDTDRSVPGTWLAVGCSTYNPGLILGNWSWLSPRWEANAATGEHPGFPEIDPDEWAKLPRTARRLKVRNDDISPALNPDALYFVEGQVLAADDAAAGNNDNNVTYHPVVFHATDNPGYFRAELVDLTIAEQPAIRAWQDHDPSSSKRMSTSRATVGSFSRPTRRRWTRASGTTSTRSRTSTRTAAFNQWPSRFGRGRTSRTSGFTASSTTVRSRMTRRTGRWMSRAVRSHGRPWLAPTTRTPMRSAGVLCTTSASMPAPARDAPLSVSSSRAGRTECRRKPRRRSARMCSDPIVSELNAQV